MIRNRTVGTIEVEGDRLLYKATGEGTPLLLIAGGGGNGDFYLPLADELADEFRIITYDRRANARSTMRHPEEFDLAQQARDAAAVLSAVGEQDAVVFGNSSGAVIALALLCAFPERVRLLIAHEPPLAKLHPAPDRWCSFFKSCEAASFGVGGPSLAATKFLFGIEVPVLEMMRAQLRAQRYLKNESPVDDVSPISSREAARYLMRQELVKVTHYQPELDALKKHGDRWVIAVGTYAQERRTFLAQCAWGLAGTLEKECVIVPGHHGSFMDRPEEWAACLRSIWNKNARTK